MSSIHGRADYEMVSFWELSSVEIISKINALRQDHKVSKSRIMLMHHEMISFPFCNSALCDELTGLSGPAEVYCSDSGNLVINYDW